MKIQAAFAKTCSSVAFVCLASCSSGSGTGGNGQGEPSSASSDNAASSGAATHAGAAVDSGAAKNYPGADLGLAPVAPGYVRYITAPRMVEPGGDVMWEDWVGPPLASDMDVADLVGVQSKGGHHANLYGTTDVQPVGTNHAYLAKDQLTQRNLGALGGEVNGGGSLPAGAIFRALKGNALLIQAHYINAGAEALVAHTAIDVKLTPVNPANKVASILSVVNPNVNIPPGPPTTTSTTCVLNQDYKALMWANHMHQWGTSQDTELIMPDGTMKPLKVDPKWDANWAFHAVYTKFTVDNPDILPAGASIRTTCTWTNDTNKTITFPDEMCIFGVFILADNDASCAGGGLRQQ